MIETHDERVAKVIFVLIFLFAVVGTTVGQNRPEGKPEMKKLTPVLVVERIEPCLDFWIQRLGFKKTVEVPEGNQLGFVILVKGSVEIMYQSRASVAKDVPALAGVLGSGSTSLYIEVEKLDTVIQALKGIEVVVPMRKTFYGAVEIGVREPGGTLVVFSETGAGG